MNSHDKILRTYQRIICVEGENGDRAHIALFWHPNGLPIDDVYPSQLAKWRRRGLRVGQVLLLRNGKGRAKTLIHLIQETWQLILRLRLTHVLILCHPNDVWRYHYLQFRKLPWGECRCGLAGMLPTIAMVMDVEKAKREAKDVVKNEFWPEGKRLGG